MATTQTAQAAPGMSTVQTPAAPVALNVALVAAGGAYVQADQQKIVDMVNDLRTLVINAGLAK